jgi:hypothetical protein
LLARASRGGYHGDVHRRLAIAALALVSAAATVVVGGSHFCRMESAVRTHCCCHSGKPPAGPRVKRDMSCCQALATAGDAPTAAFAPDAPRVDPPQLVATLDLTRLRDAAGVCEVHRASARAPPDPTGVPLYVQHCRYLN